MESKKRYLRWANITAFIITLIVNGLSNTTLIGGRTTAEVAIAIIAIALAVTVALSRLHRKKTATNNYMLLQKAIF